MSTFLSSLPTRLKTSLAACYRFKNWPATAWTAEQAASRIHLVHNQEFLPETFAPEYMEDSEFTAEQLAALYPAAIIDEVELKAAYVAAPAGYDIGWKIGFALRQVVGMETGDGLTFEEIVERIVKSDDATYPGLSELRVATPGTYLDFGNFDIEGPFFTRREAKATQGDIVSYYVTLYHKRES